MPKASNNGRKESSQARTKNQIGYGEHKRNKQTNIRRQHTGRVTE